MPSELGIIPMNSTGFLPILSSISCPVEFNRSNSTGQGILLKMGRNSWIYSQFEQYFMPSELGIIPMNSTGFLPILSSISCPVEFDRSNSTGQGILLKMGRNSWIYSQFEQYFMPSELGIIPMNSTGFLPILSSISCPVEFDRLVEFDRA